MNMDIPRRKIWLPSDEREPHFDIPIIALDDAMHHANDLNEIGATVFVPAYEWNTGLDSNKQITRVAQGFGTIDTFVVVHQHLIDHGILPKIPYNKDTEGVACNSI